jgi:hypothetical protein
MGLVSLAGLSTSAWLHHTVGSYPIQRCIAISGHDAWFGDIRDIDMQQVMIANLAKGPRTSVGEAILELKAKNPLLDLSVAGAFGGVAVKSAARPLKA